MSPECGPWRSCDFHQYRSWLRKPDSAPSTSSISPDKDKLKTKKLRRRPAAGEYQLTFRHHTDPAEYERDYLTQVTHARCRAANPSASLLATELTSTQSSASSDRSVVQLLPPQPCASVESRPLSPAPAAAPAPAPAPARCAAPGAAPAATPAVQDTASTPDLSTGSGTPPPRPTPPSSSPDLCHLPQIGAVPRPLRRRSLPPSATASSLAGVAAAAAGPAAATAAYRRPVAGTPRPTAGPPAARHARSVSVQRDTAEPAVTTAAAALRQPRRQPSTPHTVTLDLQSPPGFGGMAQARKNGYKPRGLTKIQLASSVPENLTIIVGRKLEISLSGTKRGRQRGKTFR
ncbi:translation initiation factor IF-2-like [Amphibalanus amphitrite]|uniref:translation initiation factor IF-2-like n=1 Tax=Amphibalanus amphitrite TaxID=1232801 RepID=UPI001C923839|nr:translation initiation factor IF-2-like [Amphibalanus amphitrite]